MITKEQLSIAIPAKGIHLTGDDFQRKIHEITENLSFIKQAETIVISVKSKHHLFPVVGALIGKNVKMFIFEQDEKKEIDYQKIKTLNPVLVISDHEMPQIIKDACTIVNPVLEGSTGDYKYSSDAVIKINEECTITFYLKSGTENVFNHVVLNQSLNILDSVYAARKSDVLLISGNNSQQEILLDLLWAATRSVSVVYDEEDTNKEFRSFFYNEEAFAMDFGLFFFGGDNHPEHPDKKYKLLMDAARFADEQGFSAVWTPERHFNEFGGLFPNPSVLGAALAMITKKIQLRAGSIVSPLHHSLRIAEEWSLVDNLSNGRAGLSFGSGWQCDDFVLAPANYKTRHELMLKQVEEVKKLWQGKSIVQENGFGKQIDVKIFPKPLQKELPVWITVSGKKETFIDAGKTGVHILTHLLWQDPSELIEKIAAYRESLAIHGFDPAAGKVTVMVHTYLGTNLEEVKNVVKEPLKKYIKSSAFLIESMTKSNVPDNDRNVGGRYGAVNEEIPAKQMEELLEIAFERFFYHSALLGTPETAAKLLRKIRSYGVDEIACLVDFGIPDHAIMEGLKHLAAFKKSYSADSTGRYPVSLFHCPELQYEELCKENNNMELLRSLRKVAVTAETATVNLGHNCIAFSINENVSSGSFIEIIKNEKEITMDHLTGMINEDF